MATDSPFSFNGTVYHEYEEPINKPAQIGAWITFIILTLILNTVVIVCIFRLYSKKPSTKLGSPKLLVILVCCLLDIVDASVPSAIAAHINRINRQELEDTFTCGSLVFLELSSFALSAVVTLLIAVVIVMEGVKFQRVVNLRARTQMAVAGLLLALAGLYAAVVVTPVFFLLWLEGGAAQPCREEDFGLNINPDEHRARMINVVHYVVPHCAVFSAFFLFLALYLTRRRSASSPYVQYYHYPPAPVVVAAVDTTGGSTHGDPPGGVVNATGDVTTTTTDVSNPTNNVSSAPTRVDGTANPPYSAGPPVVHIATPTPQPPPHGANPREEEEQAGGGGFPWYTLLAAVVSLLLGLVFFLSQFQDLGQDFVERRRLWAAGVLLQVLRGVLLPCCWLLDRELRSACCCRSSGARSAGHADAGRSQQEVVVRL